MTIAVDSEVKHQSKQNQKKDTPHNRMTYTVKTGKQMHRSDCVYLQDYQGRDLPANTLYLYKELIIQSKEEGKDQELIQPSTTPDPGHHMTKRQKHKKTPQTRDHLIPAGDHKAARNRQNGIINTIIKHIKITNGIRKNSTAFERPVNS